MSRARQFCANAANIGGSVKRIIVLASVLAFVLSGCLGGKSNSSKKTTTTTTTQTTSPSPMPKYVWPPTVRFVSQSDVDDVATIGLQTTDVPSDWKMVENARTSWAEDSVNEKIVQCLFGESPSPITAYGVSAQYVSPNGANWARSYTRVVENQSAAATDFKAFTATRISDCEKGSYELQSDPLVPMKGKRWGKSPPNAPTVDEYILPPDAKDVTGFRVAILPLDTTPLRTEYLAHGFGRYEIVLVGQGELAFPSDSVMTKMIEGIRNRASTTALARAKM